MTVTSDKQMVASSSLITCHSSLSWTCVFLPPGFSHFGRSFALVDQPTHAIRLVHHLREPIGVDFKLKDDGLALVKSHNQQLNVLAFRTSVGGVDVSSLAVPPGPHTHQRPPLLTERALHDAAELVVVDAAGEIVVLKECHLQALCAIRVPELDDHTHEAKEQTVAASGMVIRLDVVNDLAEFLVPGMDSGSGR